MIVAPGAGVASAIGLLIAPIAFDYSRSFPTLLEAADWSAVGGLFAEMEAQGRRMLRAAGIAEADTVIERSVDGRFQGQLHEIQAPLPDSLDAMALDDFISRFNARYRELYHYVPDHTPIELLTWRVRVSGERAPLKAPRLPQSATDPTAARKGERLAYFAELADFVPTPVYDRYRLGAGMEFPGPAIIEERESTIVVRPPMRARVDEYGSVRLCRGPAEGMGGFQDAHPVD